MEMSTWSFGEVMDFPLLVLYVEQWGRDPWSTSANLITFSSQLNKQGSEGEPALSYSSPLPPSLPGAGWWALDEGLSFGITNEATGE